MITFQNYNNFPMPTSMEVQKNFGMRKLDLGEKIPEHKKNSERDYGSVENKL